MLYSCFIACAGLSIGLIPWIHDYAGLATLAALYGFTISANYALVSVILVDLISLVLILDFLILIVHEKLHPYILSVTFLVMVPIFNPKTGKVLKFRLLSTLFCLGYCSISYIISSTFIQHMCWTKRFVELLTKDSWSASKKLIIFFSCLSFAHSLLAITSQPMTHNMAIRIPLVYNDDYR